MCVLNVVILFTGGCVAVRFARHGGCASHGERRLILELCWGLVAAALEPSASLPHVSPWLLSAFCISSAMAWDRVVGLSRACVQVFLDIRVCPCAFAFLPWQPVVPPGTAATPLRVGCREEVYHRKRGLEHALRWAGSAGLQVRAAVDGAVEKGRTRCPHQHAVTSPSHGGHTSARC